MKKFSLRLGAAVVLSLVLAAPAFAQATRTWVSGVGDDANPCSRTAPCKTFAGAISKTAAGGTINVLDPGGYGAVTITKSITIDGGGPGMGGILATGTNGVVINAAASDVITVRNLNIDGSGSGINGIRFLAGGSLHVENVEIQRFGTAGIAFQPSASSQLFINNADVHNNSNGSSGTGAILVSPTGTGIANVSIKNARMNENGFGLRANPRSMVVISDCMASGNVNFGIAAVGTTDVADVTVENCQIANNGYGGSIGAGVQADGSLASVNISMNVIAKNQNGLRKINGGAINSWGNNRVVDNGSDGAPSSTIASK